MTLSEALHLVKRHLKLLTALPTILAILTTAYSFLCMPDEYTASTSMYVLAHADGSQTAMSSADMSTAQLMANDIAELAQSERVISSTEKQLNLDSLEDYSITVAGESTTRLINVTVVGPTADGVASVANEITANTAVVAKEVMNVDSINTVDPATAPKQASGPNRLKLIVAAALGGFMVGVAYLLIQDSLDTRIRNAEEAEELLGVPVIGRIPAVNGGR